MAEQTGSYRPRCKNLYCKSMMVYGEEFESDPDYQGGMSELLCLGTSKGQGPDGADVSVPSCSDPQRECFREY
jgi:hypothetical protein